MDAKRTSDKVYPKRPPRLHRLFLRPFYFVTFNTHQRLHLLARAEVHEVFGSFCERAQGHNVAVGCYVLMPDHIHLFVALPPEGMMLSRLIQGLKSVLGKKLLALGHNKPHWQEGFFDHLLRSSESYAQKWDYVRMNPVRAGFTKTPEDWPYQGEIVRLSFD